MEYLARMESDGFKRLEGSWELGVWLLMHLFSMSGFDFCCDIPLLLVLNSEGSFL